MNVLNFNNLLPSLDIAMLVGAFIVTGLFLNFRGDLWRRLAMLVLALALVPLCYMPNLFVAENWASP